MNIVDRILKNPRKRILKDLDTEKIINVEILDDPENVEEEGTIYNSSFFNELLNELYPIGRVVEFYDAEDHSNYLGFQWVRCSEGKFSVGYKANDVDFGQIGKIGGDLNHKHLTHFGADPSAMYIDLNKSNNRALVYETTAGFISPIANGGNMPIRMSYTDDEKTIPPFEVFAKWRRIE